MPYRYFYFLLFLVWLTPVRAQYRGGHGSGSDAVGSNYLAVGGGNTAAMYNGGTGRGDRMAAMDNEAAVLPLGLLDFGATVAGNWVAVDWQTGYERDIVRYSVTRSADGQRFDPIGSLTARGGSRLASYHFDDTSPLDGTSYYRLRWWHTDGSSAYSPVRTVDRRAATAWKVALSPNPSPQQPVVLELAGLPPAVRVAVTVTDALGRSVLTRDLQPVDGTATVSLPTGGFATGVYTVHLSRSDGQQLTQQLTVTR